MDTKKLSESDRKHYARHLHCHSQISIFYRSTNRKRKIRSRWYQSFLRDNLAIETDPLVSQAIGGVKLKVLAKDEEKAGSILKSIKAYYVDDEGNPIVCPNCKGEHIEMYTTINNFKFLMSFLVGLTFFTLRF